VPSWVPSAEPSSVQEGIDTATEACIRNSFATLNKCDCKKLRACVKKTVKTVGCKNIYVKTSGFTNKRWKSFVTSYLTEICD
jgi:hypothetical protein